MNVGMTVAFDGDSRTVGYGLSKSAYNTPSCITSLTDAGCLDWPSQLMLMSALRGRNNLKYNEAIGGAAVENMNATYAANLHPYSPVVTGNPGILFEMGGINDVNNLSYTAATIEGFLTTYWATAKADGWTLVVYTLFRRGDSTAVGDSHRRAVNQWILAQAGTGAYDYVVDLDKLIQDPTDITFMQGDFIHPNAAGSYAIARATNAVLWGDGETTNISFSVPRPWIIGPSPTWQKYSFLFIANGTSSCANANGCVQVTGPDGTVYVSNAPNATSGAFEATPYLAGLFVHSARVHTTTACTGSTNLQMHDLGDARTSSTYYAANVNYSLTAAVSNTNQQIIALAANSPTMDTDTVAARLSVSSGTIDQTAAGCAFDLFLLLSVTQ
jgi:lysophospholipase L1-like esterase